MKILKKRAIALLIDGFIWGVIDTVAIRPFYLLIPDGWKNLAAFIVLCPLFFRDIVFRNASIGKKLVGIAVYDEKWECPRFGKMILRSAVMLSLGYVWLIIITITGGDKTDVLRWETERFGTRVVSKKDLKKWREEAKSLPGDLNENTSRLYDEYLKKMYPGK